jgi:hypothetical protein
MKRSRRGILYDLATDPAAALHFPGRMWEEHMTQIKLLEQTAGRPPVKVRYQPAVPLDRMEILRMRASLATAAMPVLSKPIEAFRWLRARLR